MKKNTPLIAIGDVRLCQNYHKTNKHGIMIADKGKVAVKCHGTSARDK